MTIVQVCVGSSCHIKGAPEIVEALKESIHKYGLEDEVVLTGSFCLGKCNRTGVTVTVNDEVYTGITATNFKEFFTEKILKSTEAKG